MNARATMVITGFMAAGKTSVSAAASQLLGCRLIDLDELLKANEGRSAQTIIDEEGECRFRTLEAKALGQALGGETEQVIALGGGTWMVKENRILVARNNGLVVWLDTPFDICWRRISSEAATRPLAKDYEGTRLLFEQRQPIYAMSHVRVDGGNDRRIAEIAQEIAGLAKIAGWKA